MGTVDFEHQVAFLQEKLLAEDGYFGRKKKESVQGQAADRKNKESAAPDWE